MKKNLYILTFFVIILNISIANAAWSCKLSSWPWDSIRDYVSDLNSLLSAVSSDANKVSCWSSWTWILDNAKWETSKALWYLSLWTSKIIDFEWFWTSWEFNLYPLFIWKIPNEFYRDHDFLWKQNDKIESMMKSLANKCAMWSPIKSDKIKELAKKYKIEDYSNLWKTLVWFRQLTNKWTSYFRCNVVWSVWSCENTDNNPLLSWIEKDYSDDIKDQCNKADTNFDKIMESIKSIFKTPFWFAAISKWIKEWKSALKTLWQAIYNSDMDAEYLENEKKQLATYLSQNWIRWSQAEAMMNNLDCANWKSWKWISECIKERISAVSSKLAWIFNDLKKSFFDKIPEPNMIVSNTKSLITEDAINKEIDSDYKNLNSLLYSQNWTQERTLANLINLHKTLLQTDDILKENLMAAYEACKLQASSISCPRP